MREGSDTIQLEHVSKIYSSGSRQTVAVDDVSLTVERGEVFGLIGHSGAGKSTLLRCINLLERPTSGQVTVDGVRLDTLRPRELQARRRKIGMIFQHFHLLSSATVAENVAFPLRLAGMSRLDREKRVREVLAWVGLAGMEDKYPAQLSGGQKQRVAIARALAPEPAVLLCDEATSALDPQTTQTVLDLLLDIQRRLGLTLVVVTHDISVVQRICDRVAVMHRGKVVESGSTADVLLHPRHSLTRELVREAAADGTAEAPPAAGVRTVLTFVGDIVFQPVLADTAAMTGRRFSIIGGRIDRLKDRPFGRLVVDWDGTPDEVRPVVQRLESLGIVVEWVDAATVEGRSR
jgi:D-methionine transport system ATP-binding protein